jgi:hypothetical protein
MLIIVCLSGCATKQTVWIYADDLDAMRKRVTDAEVVHYGFTPGNPDTLTISVPKHQRKMIAKEDSPVQFDDTLIDLKTGEVLSRRTHEFLLH